MSRDLVSPDQAKKLSSCANIVQQMKSVLAKLKNWGAIDLRETAQSVLDNLFPSVPVERVPLEFEALESRVMLSASPLGVSDEELWMLAGDVQTLTQITHNEVANSIADTSGIHFIIPEIAAVPDPVVSLDGTYQFNGKGQFLQTDPGVELNNLTKEISVEFEMKRDGWGGYGAAIISKPFFPNQWCDPWCQFRVARSGESNKIVFSVALSGERQLYVVSNQDIPNQEWVHVLGTYEAETGKLRLYLNGQLEAEKIDTQHRDLMTVSNTDLFLGRGQQHDPSAALYSGQINDVRIYDQALSSSQAFLEYQTKMSGKTLSSGKFEAYHESLDPVFSVEGEFNFSGNNSSLQITPGSELLLQNEISLSFWAKREGWGDNWANMVAKPFFPNMHWDPWYQFRIGRYEDSDRISFHLAVEGERHIYVVSTDPMPNNEWVLITATYDGQTMRLYMNDKLEGERTDGRDLFPVRDTNLILGGGRQFEQKELFSGELRDLDIYNYALSADQLEVNYLGEGAAAVQDRIEKGDAILSQAATEMRLLQTQLSAWMETIANAGTNLPGMAEWAKGYTIKSPETETKEVTEQDEVVVSLWLMAENGIGLADPRVEAVLDVGKQLIAAQESADRKNYESAFFNKEAMLRQISCDLDDKVRPEIIKTAREGLTAINTLQSALQEKIDQLQEVIGNLQKVLGKNGAAELSQLLPNYQNCLQQLATYEKLLTDASAKMEQSKQQRMAELDEFVRTTWRDTGMIGFNSEAYKVENFVAWKQGVAMANLLDPNSKLYAYVREQQAVRPLLAGLNVWDIGAKIWDFIFSDASSEYPETVVPPERGIVLADKLNLRINAGTNFTSIAKLNAGTIFVVIGRNVDNTWLNVKIPAHDGVKEMTGWVCRTLNGEDLVEPVNYCLPEDDPHPNQPEPAAQTLPDPPEPTASSTTLTVNSPAVNKIMEYPGNKISGEMIANWDKLSAVQQSDVNTILDLSQEGALPENNQKIIDYFVENYLGTLSYNAGQKKFIGVDYGTGNKQCKPWLQDIVIKEATDVKLPSTVTNKDDKKRYYTWNNDNDYKNVKEIVQIEENADAWENIFEMHKVLSGDIIQMKYDGYSHTAVVWKVEKDGVWVFDTNFGYQVPMLPDKNHKATGIIDPNTKQYRDLINDDIIMKVVATHWLRDDNTVRIHKMSFDSLNCATIYRVN